MSKLYPIKYINDKCEVKNALVTHEERAKIERIIQTEFDSMQSHEDIMLHVKLSDGTYDDAVYGSVVITDPSDGFQHWPYVTRVEGVKVDYGAASRAYYAMDNYFVIIKNDIGTRVVAILQEDVAQLIDHLKTDAPDDIFALIYWHGLATAFHIKDFVAVYNSNYVKIW